MKYNKENIILKLKEIKPLLQNNYSLKEIALFGSYARDEQTVTSDIDILVKADNISFTQYNQIYYLIKEKFTDIEIDLVSLNAIKPKYLERIQPEIVYA